MDHLGHPLETGAQGPAGAVGPAGPRGAPPRQCGAAVRHLGDAVTPLYTTAALAVNDPIYRPFLATISWGNGYPFPGWPGLYAETTGLSSVFLGSVSTPSLFEPAWYNVTAAVSFTTNVNAEVVFATATAVFGQVGYTVGTHLISRQCVAGVYQSVLIEELTEFADSGGTQLQMVVHNAQNVAGLTLAIHSYSITAFQA